MYWLVVCIIVGLKKEWYCMRTPFEGMGKPEALKGDLQGYWSRRITSEHRLVYKYEHKELWVAACRYYYGK